MKPTIPLAAGGYTQAHDRQTPTARSNRHSVLYILYMGTEGSGVWQVMASFDKPDAVKGRLVKFLRSLGFSYRDLPQTIKGQPDGLVGRLGKDQQVEFKTGKAKLTEAQAVFMLNWRGADVTVLRDEVDCLEMFRNWGP